MVLILAILVIAAVLGAAAAFGNLIIREIQQSRLIDQSIQAHYLAESGVERALQQIRRREAVRDCQLVAPGAVCGDNGFCPFPNSDVPCVAKTDSGLSGRGGWQVEVANALDFSIRLTKGESLQIDLFNPIQEAGPNIEFIKVFRDDPSAVLYGEFTNVTNILGVGGTNCGNQPPVFKNFLPDPGTIIGTFAGQDIDGDCSYSFRVNYPPGSSGSSLSILLTIYDSADQQLPIPGRLLVDSQASFGQSLQKVRVGTPIRPPLSGLYDFVLFSEEKIVK